MEYGSTLWCQIISCLAFKRSGIYPFNPNALDYGANDRSSSANGGSNSENLNSNDVDGNSVGDVGCSSANILQEFTLNQLELFQRRFENDYDNPDPVYLQWLKVYQPFDVR